MIVEQKNRQYPDEVIDLYWGGERQSVVACVYMIIAEMRETAASVGRPGGAIIVCSPHPLLIPHTL